MSGKYKVGDDQIAHFVTFSVVGWIDALTRTIYKEIIVESLCFCHEYKGLNIHAWVIMSNHVHLIVSCRTGYRISAAIRDFKKYTSKKIYAAIAENPQESRKEWMLWIFDRAGRRNANNINFQFWQQDNHFTFTWRKCSHIELQILRLCGITCAAHLPVCDRVSTLFLMLFSGSTMFL